MRYILGLDLGTNSIGWSVIKSDYSAIINSGVRIFPEGVNRANNGAEISKNETRRNARQIRRQLRRKRYRKYHLLLFLIEYDLIPFYDIQKVENWLKTKDFPDTPILREWFALNPYELRAKALDQQLSEHELGRVFYHLAQRRGFLSNRKAQKAEEGAIYDGGDKAKEVDAKIGIKETQRALEDYRTLGEYLNDIDDTDERKRNRYTTRHMYLDEFMKIWDTQSKYNTWMTEEIKSKLCDGVWTDTQTPKDGILFFQRPLRSQKHLIGKCQFEKTKARSPISTLEFEELRAWKDANNIRCNGYDLSSEDRQKVAHFLFTKKGPQKFKAIRKCIAKSEASYKFNYADTDTFAASSTNYQLLKLFGKQWNSFSPKEKEDIWHLIFSCKDTDWLIDYGINNWKLDDNQLKLLAKIRFKDEYSHYSRKVIRLILPYIRLGYNEFWALTFAGIQNVFGNEWELLDDDEKMTILDTVEGFKKTDTEDDDNQFKDETIIQQLKRFLKDAYDFTDKDLQKLYIPTVIISEKELKDKLEDPDNLRNPIVQQALFELKTVVNKLIEEYGPFKKIKLEMARDLKNGKQARERIDRQNRENKKKNDKLAKRLDELGIRVTHESLLKLKLYEELKGHKCPYTGQQIALSPTSANELALFSDKVQIEHIVPWSRSLNDSYTNKTLCAKEENIAKGDKTPFEFYSSISSDKWDTVRNQALNILPKEKFHLFIRKEIPADFINRQLNDTRYISRQALAYLKTICKSVNVCTGQHTARLRHMWGLNSILNPAEDSKTRDDHRHHALDAITIAFTRQETLTELTNWNKYQRSYDLKNFDPPYTHFRADVENSIESILVSHKKVDRVITTRHIKQKVKHKTATGFETIEVVNKVNAVRGQLHKESLYGQRIHPKTKQKAYHIRKSLSELETHKHIAKIADDGLRAIIEDFLYDNGVDINAKSYKIPAGVFYEYGKDVNQMVSRIRMPSKNGLGNRIKKVRLRENLGNAQQLKDKQNGWVNPKNNHHIELFRMNDGTIKERIISFWEAAERKNQHLPVINKQIINGDFLMSFAENDVFVLGQNFNLNDIHTIDKKELAKCLYRVQKISKGDYSFRLITESAQKATMPPFYIRIASFKAWSNYNPQKVKIDELGNINL